MAFADQAGKQAADEVVAAIPALETFVDAQLAKLQATLTTVTGASLADITAERTEALNQFFDGLHGILDRINLPQIIKPRAETPKET